MTATIIIGALVALFVLGVFLRLAKLIGLAAVLAAAYVLLELWG